VIRFEKKNNFSQVAKWIILWTLLKTTTF
jgi:hypothetical protein